MELVGIFLSILLVIHAAMTWPLFGDNIVDLSYAFDENVIGWPTERQFELRVTQNGTSDNGNWLQEEEYSSGTHIGTHMDAPCHMAKGRWTLNQIPLYNFIGHAAVIDITDRARRDRDALLKVEDLQAWERMAGRTLDDSIVFLRSGWGSRWPNREAYLGNANNDINNLHFPGISGEAVRWLVQNRKIYGMGVDTLSLDSGLNLGRGDLQAHLPLLEANLYGIENVANLHKLPIFGATVIASPMKIEYACGGPVRIMAFLP